MQIDEGLNPAFLRHDEAEEELVQVFPRGGEGGRSHGGARDASRAAGLVRKKQQVGWSDAWQRVVVSLRGREVAAFFLC